jgi:hypothetical protein
MSRQCEKQIGVRPTTKWNAVSIPVAVICPHNAAPGSPYCDRHRV